MPEYLKYSIWSKLIAISFVLLIVLGNCWFTYAVLDRPCPLWIIAGFCIGVANLCVSGVGLFFLYLKGIRR